MSEYMNPVLARGVEEAAYKATSAALIAAWTELLDKGVPRRLIVQRIRQTVRANGQPAWKAAPMECALAHLIELRKARSVSPPAL
jgi:anti-sigma factor RsiW